MEGEIGIKHFTNSGNHGNRSFSISVKSLIQSSRGKSIRICVELPDIKVLKLIAQNRPTDPLNPKPDFSRFTNKCLVNTYI